MKLAAASLLAASAMLAPGIASASEGDTEPTTATVSEEGVAAHLRPRLERACLRIPNLEIRTDRVLTRLSGDETVRGSLAWLETKIADASDAGRDQLATVLENRLAVRTQSIEVLELRQRELATLRERCVEHGVEL
jgi:hypothetical protein